jgi:hypothetical protein
MSDAADKRCVFCERTSTEVPVLSVDFRGSTFGICSQHLPVLIHDPAQLAGRLAGAESLEAADHHD